MSIEDDDVDMEVFLRGRLGDAWVDSIMANYEDPVFYPRSVVLRGGSSWRYLLCGKCGVIVTASNRGAGEETHAKWHRKMTLTLRMMTKALVLIEGVEAVGP